MAEHQRDGLERTMKRRDLCLLTAVHSALAFEEGGGYHSPEFFEAASDWFVLDIRDTQNPSLVTLERSIAERVRSQAFQSYIQEASDRLHHEGSKSLPFAMGLAVWIEKEAKKLSKKFADPITPCVTF